MSLLRVCKAPDEGYMDYLNRLTNARYCINCVTPSRMSHKEKVDKLVLSACLCRLQADDLMHRQLVVQKDVSLNDTQAAFLHVDQDSKVVAAVESANAASSGLCFTCHLPGHLSKDCPHRGVTSYTAHRWREPLRPRHVDQGREGVEAPCGPRLE